MILLLCGNNSPRGGAKLDNRNYHRRDRRVGQSSIAAFMEGKGIYFVVFTCLAVIGITAYLTLGGAQKKAQAPTPTPDNAQVGQVQAPSLQEEIDRLQAQATPTPVPTPTPAPTATPTPAPVVKETVKALLPVKGEVLREFSADQPVFFPTLNTWMVHKGVDLKAEEGTQVLAALDGTVESVSNDPETGYTVVISHSKTLQTVYGNLAAPENIQKGPAVKQGDVIGVVGKSMQSELEDAPHVHFAYLENGNAKDPMEVCQSR